MPQKKRQASRRCEPKLFLCTGFGKCDMVFTRSEHLARHARKHTGEKPFRCVVPNCDRMFSRFDNMMQHTHTHSRTKKKDSSDLSDGILSPMSVPEDNSMMHVPPMPIAPQTYMIDNHRLLPPHMYYQPMCPPSPASEQYYSALQRPWPIYYSPPPQLHHPVVMPPPPISPPASEAHQQSHYQPQSPVSHTADYCHRKNSIDSTTHKRRLSWFELSTPIQELGTTIKQDDSTVSTDDEDDYDERQMSPISLEADCTKTRFRFDGIDITADEYEALQGFGKFCTEPVVRDSIKLPPLNSFYTSPHAFRQHISIVQESFQRGAN